MKLTLVRHPHTTTNAKSIMAGYITNSRITQIGKKQMALVAKRLSKEKFDAIYSSDLTRCKQLAKAIQKHHPKIKIVFSKDLRERHFGIYEGKSQKLYSVAESKENSTNDFKPKNGESRIESANRLRAFLKKIEKKHEHALIVTHGGIKRSFLNLTYNLDLHYKTNFNTGVSLIDFTNKKVHYTFDSSHLPKNLHT